MKSRKDEIIERKKELNVIKIKLEEIAKNKNRLSLNIDNFDKSINALKLEFDKNKSEFEELDANYRNYNQYFEEKQIEYNKYSRELNTLIYEEKDNKEFVDKQKNLLELLKSNYSSFMLNQYIPKKQKVFLFVMYYFNDYFRKLFLKIYKIYISI